MQQRYGAMAPSSMALPMYDPMYARASRVPGRMQYPARHANQRGFFAEDITEQVPQGSLRELQGVMLHDSKHPGRSAFIMVTPDATCEECASFRKVHGDSVDSLRKMEGYFEVGMSRSGLGGIPGIDVAKPVYLATNGKYVHRIHNFPKEGNLLMHMLGLQEDGGRGLTLTPDQTLKLNGKTFGNPCLIACLADWCQHCKKFKSRYATALSLLESSDRFLLVDHKDVVSGVNAYPCFFYADEKGTMYKVVGLRRMHQLLFLKTVLLGNMAETYGGRRSTAAR